MLISRLLFPLIQHLRVVLIRGTAELLRCSPRTDRLKTALSCPRSNMIRLARQAVPSAMAALAAEIPAEEGSKNLSRRTFFAHVLPGVASRVQFHNEELRDKVMLVLSVADGTMQPPPALCRAQTRGLLVYVVRVLHLIASCLRTRPQRIYIFTRRSHTQASSRDSVINVGTFGNTVEMQE